MSQRRKNENKTSHTRRHNFHGDPARFPVVADFISDHFGQSVKFVADVAGGQGALSRILNKKFNYDSEVIDPRGNTVKGVDSRSECFAALGSDYYDLVIGLHPDEATQEIALSALLTKTVIVPCCNFWDRSKRLGTDALIDELALFYAQHGVEFSKVSLDLETPKRIALVTSPPATKPDVEQLELPSLEKQTQKRGDAWMKEKKQERE